MTSPSCCIAHGKTTKSNKKCHKEDDEWRQRPRSDPPNWRPNVLRLQALLRDTSRSKLQHLADAAAYIMTTGLGQLPTAVRRGRLGFAGPPWRLVTHLRRLLETITLEDFQLNPTKFVHTIQPQLTRAYNGLPSIMFWNILQTEPLSIVLFALPKGTCFELHSHPGMIVLTKVLYGTCKVTAGSILAEEENKEHEGDALSSTTAPSRDSYHGRSSQQTPYNVHSTAFTTETVSTMPACSERAPSPPSPPCVLTASPSVLFSLPLTQLALDLPLFDYGAVPTTTGAYRSALDDAMAAQMDAARLWKRMLYGARKSVLPGQQALFLELFNATVSGRRSSSACRSDYTLHGRSTSDLYIDPMDGWLSTIVSTPVVGNLHRIVSDSQMSIILDVISPPYDTPEARGCDHYIRVDEPEKPPMMLGEYRTYLVEGVDAATAETFSFVEFAHPPPIIEFDSNIHSRQARHTFS